MVAGFYGGEPAPEEVPTSFSQALLGVKFLIRYAHKKLRARSRITKYILSLCSEFTKCSLPRLACCTRLRLRATKLRLSSPPRKRCQPLSPKHI